MDHCPYLKPWLCALLLAAAWPVAAQDSVIFTKPADLPTDKANSFMGSNRKNSGSFNAPNPLSNGRPQADYDILPGAPEPRILSPAEVKQWQKSMDEKKNWILLTPEQILDVPTPEKIFGLPDPNHEENLSVEERYLRRQERQRNFSATNALSRADGLQKSDKDNLQSRNASPQQVQQDRRNGMLAASRLGSGSPASASVADAGRNPDSIWHSAFNVVPELPKPDPQQVAAMDRFRAMMEPPPVGKPAASGFSAPAPVDHNMQAMQPYNVAGRTFAPVQNNLGRPTGLNPLPTVSGQRPSDTASKPKPLVKPAPWLSDKPDLSKPMKRKF